MRDMTPDPYPPFDGVEPYGTARSIADERAHRKRMCALGYRIFSALRWGMLGDGHISARDPVFTDHFWLLDWGVPFGAATVHNLVLVGPGGEVKDADGNSTGAVNTAGYNIHHPLLATRPDVVSASHTHTAFGKPWSANVEPFRAISQEACAFVFDQALSTMRKWRCFRSMVAGASPQHSATRNSASCATTACLRSAGRWRNRWDGS
jgi:ribulose-5-phosphate 4-epimerase/fuculose-1-phosphate aldolase